MPGNHRYCMSLQPLQFWLITARPHIVRASNILEKLSGLFDSDTEDYESYEFVDVDTSSDVSSWSDTHAISRGDGAIRRGDGSAVKRPLTRRRRKRQRSGKWTCSPSPSRGWRRVIRVVPLTGTLRARPPCAAVRPWDRDRRELGPMPPTTQPPPHVPPIGFPLANRYNYQQVVRRPH